MNRDMENLLGICLDQLEQGTAVDVILSRYPDESLDLWPYLETAAQMPQLASLPTVAVQQRSQQQFLARAAVLRSPQSDAVPFLFTLRRFLLPAASLFIVILLFGYGLVSASNNAIPGDGLYPVKRTVENIRLINAANPEEVINLSGQFQEERLREIEELLRSGRAADVIFEGDIEALNFTNWVISGLNVLIEKNTVIKGSERVGEMVRVEGHTSNGSLYADHITVLTNHPELEPTPLPAIVPTLELPETPTVTPAEPTATMSPTPTASVEPQDSAILAPIETATPLPTATTVIVPTATPSANNDDGDGGSVNVGENSNEDSGDEHNDNEGHNNNEDSGDEENNNGDENDNKDSGDEDNDSGDENDNEDSGDEDNDNSEVDEEGDNSIKRVNAPLSD